MAAKTRVLLAGLETRHGRAYAQALIAGGYRVQALVAAPLRSVHPDHAAEADEGERSRESLLAGLPVDPSRAVAFGAEPVVVDLDDGSALRRVVKNVGAVLVALDASDAQGRTGEERTTRSLLEAAQRQFTHVVYSSALHADQQTGVPPLDLKGRLEVVARRSGAPVTILRPGLLMDVFDDSSLREGVVKDGVLTSGIAVDAPVSYLAAEDLGLLALLVLEVPGLSGATLELGGPEPVTFRELIPLLWRMTGHSVTYEQLSPEETRTRSDEEQARLVQHINDAGYAVDMRPLLERLPVRLTALSEYLATRGWVSRPERVAA